MITIYEILKIVRKHENKYPMTGQPDKEAARKNGWYDCAYSIRHKIQKLMKENSNEE